jgi:hypothetical protein
MKTEIHSLEEDYYKAANALTDYRRSFGLEPGTRVRAKYQNGTPKLGVIAPFGSHWEFAEPNEVPVLLDDGGWQRWSMAHLEVIPDNGH